MFPCEFTAGNRIEQLLCVWMLRGAEHLAGKPMLHDFAVLPLRRDPLGLLDHHVSVVWQLRGMKRTFHQLAIMIVFRSIWVPIKAAVGYLLSVLAAFGVVAAVFEWGWGAELLHVDRTGAPRLLVITIVVTVVLTASIVVAGLTVGLRQ